MGPVIEDPPPLGAEGAWCIILLAAALFIMAFDWVKPDLIFMTLMALFTAARFITVKEATVGFANSGLLSVMALFAVAEGVAQTGGLERVIGFTTGKATNHAEVLIRMLVPVMISSAFLNNTPIVALMIPIILSWSRRMAMTPKPFLICLSYSAIFGGTITLIGTSTNLVIAGFQAERYPDDPDLSNMGIFDISLYGITYACWGFTFLLLFSKVLLGSRSTHMAPHEQLLVGLVVPRGSQHVGSSIAQAGLRNLQDLFLVSVTRGAKVLHAVGPDFILQEGDIVSFAGDLAKVEYLSLQYGLPVVNSETDDATEVELGLPPSHLIMQDRKEVASEEMVNLVAKARSPCRFLRCTVRKDAPCLGKNIRDIGFRTRFGAAVVAVKRVRKKEGVLGKFGKGKRERVEGRLGDIELQVDDELLLDIGPDFNSESTDVRENFEGLDHIDNSDGKEFLTAFKVKKGKVAGKTVREAGLRSMTGIYLVYVDRADGTTLHAVSPDTVLQEGDVLWFAGDVQGLAFLFKMPGVVHIERDQVDKAGIDILERKLVQVVIATQSPLIDKTVKEARFRTKYNAAIVAVQRRGERLKQRIGDIKLKPGDVLLLDAGSYFLENHRDDKAFALISDVPKSAPMKKSKMWLALGLFVGMISVQIIQSFTSPQEDYIDLWTASLLTSALMILFRCMSGDDARRSLDWKIYMTIAAAFGISKATRNTGVADNIAWLFIQISIKIGGETAIYSALYIVTSILSEILTNNAAAALMYPIASIASDSLGVPPKMIAYTLMLGASSSFMSPFGYQTNLMIFNAGGLKAVDLLRMGVPLTLWMWFGATVMLGLHDYINALLGASIGLVFAVGIAQLLYLKVPANNPVRKKLGEISLRELITKKHRVASDESGDIYEGPARAER